MPLDLLAGDARGILLTLALEDDDLRDHGALDAHVSLPGWLDEDGLDAFASAVRHVVDTAEPASFTDACRPLDGPDWAGGRALERLDPSWLEAVARIPDDRLDEVADRWLALLDGLPRRPGVSPDGDGTRLATTRIVEFARLAAGSPDVLLGWSL
ncbi:MAG: hypothetical protein RL338_117 [Chloroflexota bacterium]|jgi:hypothetical protein